MIQLTGSQDTNFSFCVTWLLWLAADGYVETSSYCDGSYTSWVPSCTQRRHTWVDTPIIQLEK